jgi:hypothetical protein
MKLPRINNWWLIISVSAGASRNVLPKDLLNRIGIFLIDLTDSPGPGEVSVEESFNFRLLTFPEE